MIPYELLSHALQNFRADISMVALFVQTTLVIHNEGSGPQKSCNEVTKKYSITSKKTTNLHKAKEGFPFVAFQCENTPPARYC